MSFAMRRTWGPTPNYPHVLNYRHPVKKEMICVAGPCSIESEEQAKGIANFVFGRATHFRGGTFRAGTYPPKEFGFSSDKAKWLEAAAKKANGYGMPYVIEWLGMDEIDLLVIGTNACIQIGARQMQNYEKLKMAASTKKPVFLKRHPGSTLDEFLGAAEYLLKYGCKELYLIERGSSSHMSHVRWDLSISIIPAIHAINPELQIIVDASHGTGRRDLVEPMTLAGLAAGANGFLVEVHPEPEKSLSDADQAFPLDRFHELYDKAKQIYEVVRI